MRELKARNILMLTKLYFLCDNIPTNEEYSTKFCFCIINVSCSYIKTR